MYAFHEIAVVRENQEKMQDSVTATARRLTPDSDPEHVYTYVLAAVAGAKGVQLHADGWRAAEAALIAISPALADDDSSGILAEVALAHGAAFHQDEIMLALEGMMCARSLNDDLVERTSELRARADRMHAVRRKATHLRVDEAIQGGLLATPLPTERQIFVLEGVVRRTQRDMLDAGLEEVRAIMLASAVTSVLVPAALVEHGMSAEATMMRQLDVTRARAYAALLSGRHPHLPPQIRSALSAAARLPETATHRGHQFGIVAGLIGQPDLAVAVLDEVSRVRHGDQAFQRAASLLVSPPSSDHWLT